MNLQESGCTIIDNVFTKEEVAAISDIINNIDTSGPAFRKTSDLFAIRRFVKEVPAISPLVFNSRLRAIIKPVV